MLSRGISIRMRSTVKFVKTLSAIADFLSGPPFGDGVWASARVAANAAIMRSEKHLNIAEQNLVCLFIEIDF